MQIGERILSRRKALGLSRKALSEKTGKTVSETAIKQYETGLRQPRIERLQRIASALGVLPGNLMYGEWYDEAGEQGRINAGRNLEQWRIRRNYSRKALAEKAGVFEQDLQDYIDGKELPGPTTLAIANLAKAEGDLLSYFHHLNKEGQEAAIERVEELTHVPKYKRDESTFEHPERL